MTLTLISIELIKIFKKWRTYIGFIAIGILTPTVQLALYFTGQRYVNHLLRGLQDAFVFYGNLFNGYLVAYLILHSLVIHIPFLIVLVGGDLLAGEATAGTYRILLIRPVSRLQIIVAKFFAGIIYTFILILWLVLLSFILSLFLFGSGELITFKNKLIIFSQNDVIWRFVCAYGFAALSMSTVLTLSFFFSSMVENAIGPIISTMAVIIIFLIISAIPIEFFQTLKPFLFTTHMTVWENFFNDTVDWQSIFNSSLILIIHIIVLFLFTVYIFLKKDILS
ncbi:ABC transporter permease [Melioribacteraceae bacterium 4301-Me]|uniref:ABC transporter permease n=1 Tax=Pyranulibacter aquaticus TaxID=3163344 RepID=UPI00359AACEF